MKIVFKTLTLLLVITFISSCEDGNKSDLKESSNETQSSEISFDEDIDESNLKDSTNKVQSIDESLISNDLILTENTLGDLELIKGMPIKEDNLKEIFNDQKTSRNVGTQDGPNYYYYDIKNDIMISTPSTDEEILSQIRINEESSLSDVYGINIGMLYCELKIKRPNMSISTEHYHIYLVQENSHIAYEIVILDYNGIDKDEYTLDDIKNSKVVSIIWR